MDIITTIETFFSYKEEIANLERETPSVDSFDSFDEENKRKSEQKLKKNSMRYLMIILTGSLRRIQIRLFIAYI